MKRAIFTICFATTVVAMVGCVSARAQWARLNAERSPPPTEPSIALPAGAAVPAANIQKPKPILRQIIVRRPHAIHSGPVNMPSPDVLVIMVRAALAAVNQANFTENYSVLRGMTTPALQARLSAVQLGNALADLRKQNLDLSPVLVLTPEFTELPKLSAAGVLTVKGYFPSRPLRIDFTIDFVPIDSFWMIDQLSVSAPRADMPLKAAAPMPQAPEQTATSAPAPLGGSRLTMAGAPRPINSDTYGASAAASKPAQTHMPANEMAKPESSEAKLIFMPGSLPTSQFAAAEYKINYQPTFVPINTSSALAKLKTTSNIKAVTRSDVADARHDRQGPSAYVQVTSQRSEAEAKAAFGSLRAKYPEFLGDRPFVVRRADLGYRGIYYRAQIGPVSAELASQQCSQLKAVGMQCFVQYN